MKQLGLPCSATRFLFHYTEQAAAAIFSVDKISCHVRQWRNRRQGEERASLCKASALDWYIWRCSRKGSQELHLPTMVLLRATHAGRPGYRVQGAYYSSHPSHL